MNKITAHRIQATGLVAAALVALAACGGAAAQASAPTSPAPLSAQEAATMVSCHGYVESSDTSSVPGVPDPTSTGTCTNDDGTSLVISMWANGNDRQAAETYMKVIVPDFLASDARMVYASGDNLVVGPSNTGSQTTSPAEEAAVHAAADKLGLHVSVITGKAA